MLRFTSTRVANLGNSSQLAVGVGRSRYNPERGYRFRPGNITGRDPQARKGYTLVYTSQIGPGMSGGPILDEQGNVVGINGSGYKEPNTGEWEFLGIAINTYKSWEVAVLQSEERYNRGQGFALSRRVDIETRLQVAGREKEGWVSNKENFPCEDLRAIDKLWVKYSNGRFGFSVQKRILSYLGPRASFVSFLFRIGWMDGAPLERYLRSWERMTFDLSAPAGHLPALVYRSYYERDDYDYCPWDDECPGCPLNELFNHEVNSVSSGVGQIAERAQECKL